MSFNNLNKYCSSCGDKLNRGAKYCDKCGKPISDTTINKKFSKITLKRILINAIIAIAVIIAIGVVALAIANMIADQNSADYDNYFNYSFVFTGITLIIVAAIYAFWKHKYRLAAIMLALPLIILCYSLIAPDNTGNPSQQACLYNSVTKENINKLITEYRIDNGKDIFTKNEKLDEYAQSKVDSLIDQSNDNRVKNLTSDFDEWYRGAISDGAPYIKTYYAFYQDKIENPCTVLDSFKQSKVVNSQLLRNENKMIGIGVKYTFVYIILAEEGDAPKASVSNDSKNTSKNSNNSSQTDSKCYYSEPENALHVLEEKISAAQAIIEKAKQDRKDLDQKLSSAYDEEYAQLVRNAIKANEEVISSQNAAIADWQTQKEKLLAQCFRK